MKDLTFAQKMPELPVSMVKWGAIKYEGF